MASQKSGRRPTTADVARLAGVSQSAVSRALAPDRSASAATRSKVKAAAASLGYRPNALARGMITQRTNVAALLLSEETALHFPEVLIELTRAFSTVEMSVMMFPIASLDCVEEAVDRALSYRIDGIVAAGSMPEAATETLIASRIPLVLYNREDEATRVSSVSCDHLGCGRMIGQRLLALGHRQVGLIDGPAHSVVARARAAGLIEALGKEGVVPTRHAGDFSYASGASAARALVARAPQPSVLVGLSDMMAMGALDVLRTEAGLGDADIAVVGIDGSASGARRPYRLTTVAQPLKRMAEATAELLCSTVRDPGQLPERRLLPGSWVERDSLLGAIPV